MSNNLVFTATSSDIANINKRSYLISIGNLAGMYFSSFAGYNEVQSLITESTNWVNHGFQSMVDCFNTIQTASAQFDGIVNELTTQFAHPTDAQRQDVLNRLETAQKTVQQLTDKCTQLQHTTANLTNLNMGADNYVEQNNTQAWQTELSEYGWTTASAAYDNISNCFQTLALGWVEFLDNINAMMKTLSYTVVDTQKDKIIGALSQIGPVKIDWNNIEQEATNMLGILNNQSSSLNGQFLYENDPVQSNSNYSLLFDGTGAYIFLSGGIIQADSGYSNQNPAYSWLFEGAEAGYYYISNGLNNQLFLTYNDQFNIGMAGRDANNTLNQYWKLLQKPNASSNEWYLTCAYLELNNTGNYLSYNSSNNNVVVGQTNFFAPNPQTILINKI